MASYASNELSIATATATKVADAVEVSREIIINDLSGNNFRIAFTSADASGGPKISNLDNADGVLRFIVPPCTEVWVYQSSGLDKTLNVLLAGR